MTDIKLRVYHSLPPGLRNLAASMRGYYLRSWRYGPETEGLVAQFLERDSWSSDQWRDWQQERLNYILHRAATTIPYYRDQWQARRRNGDRASWDYLENWPILEKQVLRSQPEAFVADDCDTAKMFREQTSGTTGTPLKLWWSRTTTRTWYALFEARIRRWHDVSWHDNWAIIGGQPVVPTGTSKPPFWIWNQAMHQLYLSANHISRENATAYADALRRYRVTHLFTYTSSATYLAKQILDLGITPPNQLKVVITNAEPLFGWQREVLERAFQCPVRETYGMGEIVAAASADQTDRLRIWPEVGVVEVLADETDQSMPPGETGRFVCTGLLNPDMPLIRYQVGDRGSLSASQPDAADAIQLPLLNGIEGRMNDMLITRDGRRVFWLNPIFYGLPIVEAQIIQNSLDEIRIRLVPDAGFDDSTQGEIATRLQARMDDRITIQFEKMARIPRAANNKFQPVICNIPQ